MILIFEVLLIFIASLFLCKIGFDLLNKRISTLSFMYIIFYIFYILPLILSYNSSDIFYKMYLYNESFYNDSSMLISSIINIIIVSFFIYIYRTKKIILNFNLEKYSKNFTIISLSIFVFLGFSLILLMVKAPDPSIYLVYAQVIYDYDPVLREYHSIVAIFCRLMIFFSALYFLFINKTKYSFIWYFGIAFIVCWIAGKRSFVAYSLLIFLVSLFLNSNVKPSKMLVILIFSFLGFSVFSMSYQNNIRGFEDSSNIEKKENFYLDYSRLQNERYVIYSLLRDQDVVPYVGASMLYNITFFVPRSIWSDKPYPYAVYYTNNFFNVELDNRLNWGLTTGLLDEFIANFYWFGVIFYLVLIRVFVNFNDKYLNRFSGLVGIMVGCLMVILHFAAYSYIFIFWLFLIYLGSRK